MKRSFINVFAILMILLSLIGSSIQVLPVSALGSMTNLTPDPPTGWSSIDLLGVWGFSATDIYIVGSGVSGGVTLPLIYHGSGTSKGGWFSSGTPEKPLGWNSGSLGAVWGPAFNDIYAVGWGENGSNTPTPLIYHSDGSTWSYIATIDWAADGWTEGYLESVWGTDSSNIYVAGRGKRGTTTYSTPLVYHYNGSEWASETLPESGSTAHLYGIWVASTGQVYAAGWGNSGGSTVPMVYSKIGGIWSATSLNFFPSPAWTTGELEAIWGTSASDIYVVGRGTNAGTMMPLVYHYNGDVWSASGPSLPAATGWPSGKLDAIWGNATDAFAVGLGGTKPLLYRKTSQSASGWAGYSDGTSGSYDGVWGVDSSRVYAVGGNRISYAGLDSTPPGVPPSLAVTTGTCNGTVKLTWTAPTDDYNNPDSGPVYSYLVKYSSSPFSSWAQGMDITNGLPIPVTPGTTQTMIVSNPNFTPGATYYFAVKAQDEELLPSMTYVTDNTPEPVQAAEHGGTWYIASMGGGTSYGTACDIPVDDDYNGDGSADIAVFRPSDGTWYISTAGNFRWGEDGDIPVPADYNGDGRADVAVFRPSTGMWWILIWGGVRWGEVGDIPVPGDYNGDGMDEAAVFRPSTGMWWISTLGGIRWGEPGDIPMPGDYNGDGRDEPAIFRPSTGMWWISTLGGIRWGEPSDIPMPGDYNGDGRDEPAIFRPSTGMWWISTLGGVRWGEIDDTPLNGDFNRDGRADTAIFRP